MKTLIVASEYDQKKLSYFLKKEFPNLASNLFYKTLRKKDIKINGKRISQNVTLQKGDEVVIYLADHLLENNYHIQTIFEDENILIVDKPSNLEVTGENSLTTILNKQNHKDCSNIAPCHRIDRNTTGLVLFAKKEEARNLLLTKFKNHEIEKHYVALVYGIPKETKKRCAAYLFKDKKQSQVYISDKPKKGYRKIITIYQVLEKRKNNTCLLAIEIETGRTHQIRAHLAHMGYPIIGDGKYGKNEINKKFGQKQQLLCSCKLKFNFKGNNGILDYLARKEFTIKRTF